MAISAVGALAVEWSVLSVALAFVTLRLYVRCYLQRHIALSDLFIVLAWLLLIISTVADSLSWKYGIWDERLVYSMAGNPDFASVYGEDGKAREIAGLKVFYWSAIPYYSSMYSVKASFVLFYLTLFPRTMTKLRLALYFTIGLVVIGYISGVLVGLFRCWPISSNWNIDPAQQCLTNSTAATYITYMVFHLITDILIYILPFFLLRNTYLTRSKKIGVIVLFSLGSVCIGSTVCRIALTGTNSTLGAFGAISAVEASTGIIVACLPPLKWLYHSRRRRGNSVSLPASVLEIIGTAKRWRGTVETIRPPGASMRTTTVSISVMDPIEDERHEARHGDRAAASHVAIGEEGLDGSTATKPVEILLGISTTTVDRCAEEQGGRQQTPRGRQDLEENR